MLEHWALHLAHSAPQPASPSLARRCPKSFPFFGHMTNILFNGPCNAHSEVFNNPYRLRYQKRLKDLISVLISKKAYFTSWQMRGFLVAYLCPHIPHSIHHNKLSKDLPFSSILWKEANRHAAEKPNISIRQENASNTTMTWKLWKPLYCI